MRRCLAAMLIAVLLAVSPALAADWTPFEKRLTAWTGAKEVSLAGGIDPLADAELNPLIDWLLDKGFALLPPDAPKGEGLILERVAVGGQPLLLLKRARDGALLARQRLAPEVKAVAPAPEVREAAAAPVEKAAPVVAQPMAPPPARDLLQAQPVAAGAAALVPLAAQPQRLAVWPGTSADSFDLFLLYDDSLRRFRYQGRRLTETGRFAAPTKVSRALYLQAADGDGDGSPELAAVWSEDVVGVYQGDDSHLHGFVVRPRGQGLEAASEDLKGYLAFSGGRWLLQRRGDHTLFLEQAAPLASPKGRFVAGPMQSFDRWLYDHAEWPAPSQRLLWNEEGRLVLEQGRGSKTSPLLLDFGRYQGPAVFVKLETPEYRSGFSRQDQVLSRRVPMPRRLLPCGSALYSLIRGRTAGLPLIGNPGGQDRLVRIRAAGEGLQADEPFAGVEAFIQDFDLLCRQPAPTAVLLLNEKEDGRGAAYLAVQEPR
ncbi:MAG: hypothetical protein JXB25_02660 [Deltaproteobacteria bacterium]|nr:hypothetical protein [Deltaproteobacteria bacterium]